MLSWASLADRILKRETCEKLIKYQDRSFEFKGIGVEIPGFSVSFEGFGIEPRVLQNATEAAKALDDLQYQLCQDLSKKSVREILDKDVVTRYTKARMSSLFLFSSFRIAFEAFKEDQKGQRVNLEKSIEDIQKFTSSLTSEDLGAPEGLSPRSHDAISSALQAAKVDEQQLDQVLLDKFEEFEKTQREILERVKQVQESFGRQVTELKLSGAGVELLTASKQYKKGDPNFSWKNAYFSDADIRNGYDARRPITDDIIKSIEAHEGTFVYGDPYVGKSILVKRVMFEMADKGYAVIYSSGAKVDSYADQIKGLLTSLLKTYPKMLFVADDAHKAANESFFKIFNELYDTTAEEGVHFLFVAREKQLDKEKPVIARALTKIPKVAQHRIGFSLEDATLFLQQAIKVTHKGEGASRNKINETMNFGKLLYEYSIGDPFMFSLGIKYILLSMEDAHEGGDQELEDLVSKEMGALIKKIEEKNEIIQNNELWKAAIMSAIMGIANMILDSKSKPKLFICSTILPIRFRTLLEHNILLKESEEGQLRIRHEMFAYEFLSVLYESKDYFNNNPESFNKRYGDIVECIWDSITVHEIIDMLSSCSYLYEIDRYRPISELITNHYLVPLDQYSPPPGIDDLDKAKLFCDGLGNFYLRRKEYEKSLGCYENALKVNPDYIDAWNNKGLALNNLGRYEEAIKSYDKALEINPNYATAWNSKGLALYNLGNYEEAIKHYDKALELDPNDATAWNNKGIALYNWGKHEEAIKHYDKALELEPDYAGAWNNKGIALYNWGKHEEAIKHYDKALELEPDYANAWNSKGLALNNLGNYEEAIKHYDKALELDPNDATAWNNKGLALDDLGRYEEAIKHYDKALELEPDYAGAWNNKGIALYNLGRYDEAIKSYDKALEINPNYAEAWNSKGIALNNLGRYEEAIHCFDKALELEPDYANAWYNRACSKIKKGDTEDGLADLKKAIEIDKKKFIILAKEEIYFESIKDDERFKALVMK